MPVYLSPISKLLTISAKFMSQTIHFYKTIEFLSQKIGWYKTEIKFLSINLQIESRFMIAFFGINLNLKKIVKNVLNNLLELNKDHFHF